MPESANQNEIIPREKWWWLGLALLLLLASWLYLRGYNVSLPYFGQVDESIHILGSQHLVDFGHEAGVNEHYPPGTMTLGFLLLKYFKPAEAHHGTLLPALRLITIGAWMLVVVLIALLGAMMLHPLAGLIAAAVWIVNPWVVERAHWFLPDAYLTLFTLLALWLALVGYHYGRRSFSTAAVYSTMLAIVFKTQALFVAPIILFMPMLKWRRISPAVRKDAWQQTLWNCVRFAVFLFWLLLIYPTLEADKILDFPMTYSGWTLPSLDLAWASFHNVWRTFPWTSHWLAVAATAALLLLYRRRVNAIAFLAVTMSGLAWLLGMSMFYLQSARQFFVVGAILAMLYGCGFTGLYFAGQGLLSRLNQSQAPAFLRRAIMPCCLLILLAVSLHPSYQESDALAHNFTLHDRRNDLAHYMDTSLEPGKYVTDSRSSNFKVFNRSWGGYDGVHDFPRAQRGANLLKSPLEIWRQHDAVYAIAPYPADADDPHVYFPDETVLLKSYPPDPRFRGPSMVVLRLFPMQYKSDAQLGPIQLTGYDINGTQFAAGDDMVFRHYWRAQSPTTSIHHVFNHLISEDGEIAAQVDYVPLWDARRPSTAWDDPEEIMLGREFVLSLPSDLPPGAYRLISGLYDPATWQRLIAPDGKDHIHIADIAVTQPDA